MVNVNSANSYLNLMGFSIIGEDEKFIIWKNDSNIEVTIDKIYEEFEIKGYDEWHPLEDLEDFVYSSWG